MEAPSFARAAAFAAVCRINALYMIARAGSGHIGTSFSSMDIVAWLLLEELRRSEDGRALRDIYFSSKGHDVPALYAVLIGLGLLDFELLHRLRRLGGLPGHPDVSVPFIESNTGSLGMGVSKATGMARANRLLGRDARIYVLTGDGELQEGQFWESLPAAAHAGLGEVTVIVDHNKIQSDTWVAEVNDLGDLEGKLRAFGWHVARCDGHDIPALADTLARASTVRHQPSIVVADTVKGKGVSFMEAPAMDPADRFYKFHSGAPAPDLYDKAVEELIATANGLLDRLGQPSLRLETVERAATATPGTAQRLVGAYARELVRQAERNPRLVVLDADLVVDCGLLPFRQRFPERFFECGIAEQDMVSQAGGMARRGLLPVVHSFACFLATRPNEQIYNNATEGTKVVYVGSLAGLLPGGPGHSHQSVRDIALLAGIPGVTAIQPCCEREVELALDYCLNGCAGSAYLRLESVPTEVPYTLPPDYLMVAGRGVMLRPGKDAVLIGHGPTLLSEAWRAAGLLAERWGLDLAVVNLPWLGEVDPEWLGDLAGRYAWLFTLDNHYAASGQGQMLLSSLAQLPRRPLPRTRRIGLDRIPACGANVEVLEAHRLDAESLAVDIRSTMAAGDAWRP